LLLWPALSRGQTAPPPSLVAPPQTIPAPLSPRILIPEAPAGAKIPEAARQLRFVLTGTDVEGEFEELAEARRKLAEPLIGKRITVADVFELTAKLQEIYVRAGYPLVRVVLLPQEIDNRARIRIRIIDGFVESIDGSNLAARVRERATAAVAPLLLQRRLKQSELERRLLIAGDIPGLRLAATFAPGKEIGGSILVLSGQHQLVSASLYVDNAMPMTFGTRQGVLSLAANSPLGQGEQLSVSAVGYLDNTLTTADPVRRYLTAGLIVPLGLDGWKLDIGGTQGNTTPLVTASAASQGHYDQLHVRLGYDAIKSRDLELTVYGRLDATNERIDSLALGSPVGLSQDRVRPLRAGFDGVWRERALGTSVAFGGALSRGIDWLGARTAAEATTLLPLSRQGADAVFTKLAGRIQVVQALPLDFVASLDVFAQTSFGKALLTSEQFAPIGSRMLSGFTAGSLAGDKGWVVRGELGYPFALGKAVLTPYAFAATGERIYEIPTALEIGSVRATNFGGGVRGDLPRPFADAPDASTFIEYSNHRTNQPDLDGWRIFAGGLLRY
jgi:hemolysin activation/secretion protein